MIANRFAACYHEGNVIRCIPLLIGLVACLPATAFAHKLHAEWKQVNLRIEVEAFFSDDTPAQEARVEVLDAEKNVVAVGKTDEKGKCSLRAPQPGKYDLVVDAGAGHREQVAIRVVGTLPPPEERQSSGSSPSRGELTRFPWEKLAIGCGIISLVGGAWWLSRRAASSRSDPANAKP